MERLFLLSLLILRGLRAFAFNLDSANPYVFSGPPGSYFGFAVDFFKPDSSQLNILIGAPKANTSGSGAVERGAVYRCPWQSVTGCQQLDFDNTISRRNADGVEMEFKSNQWLGATVRSVGDLILACAPLYQWATSRATEREPVGTCFLRRGSTVVEYSPCRTTSTSPGGQGFCQAGFSADFVKNNRVLVGGPGSFYWQGQIISDDIAEIFNKYNKLQLITTYNNQQATKSADPQYDDSYLGYSVTVADVNGDGDVDYITGVPRGEKALGNVRVFDGKTMQVVQTLRGVQMAAFFGYSVAVTDINSDGNVDLLVGAPLFMERGADGKLREVGQVYVYLGSSGFTFLESLRLTGNEIYSRFGSGITPLGDLNQDGYNDVAIAAPYGGPARQGVVFIHNGRAGGLDSTASQTLRGTWASSTMPPSFGYSLHGATDIDVNGYPDLIVGAFGADKAVLYRARPVISVNAILDVTPQMLNPDQKTCTRPSSSPVSCFNLRFCLQAQGKGAQSSLTFHVNVTLDRNKQKGAVKRVLFLQSNASQYRQDITVGNGAEPKCQDLQAYLIEEFRDKLSPIIIFLEYSLDYTSAADRSGLLPILSQDSFAQLSKQAYILLDCGEDNICKPDLKLSAVSKEKQIYIGVVSMLTVVVTAENNGEGAYEAELHVSIPQKADYNGAVRVGEVQSRMPCAYRQEVREVVCDLGNPMKAGTKIVAELSFSVDQLSDQDSSLQFDLQIQSSNQFNNVSSVASVQVGLATKVKVEIRGSSNPEQIFLPIPNWQQKETPVLEDDIGPSVQHIYELWNQGPSTFSKALLEVSWPYGFSNGSLLYITKLEMEGPMDCTSDREINPLNVTLPVVPESNISASGGDGSTRNHVHRRDLEKRQENELQILDCNKAQCMKVTCNVGRLEAQKNVVLTIRSRLSVATFLQADSENRSYVTRSTGSFRVLEMPYKNLTWDLPSDSTTVSTMVMWGGLSNPQPVPIWVIVLAVLAGLLLLALLILIMYKCGFFKRVRPPQDNTEKEKLQPQENGESGPEGGVEA